MRRAKLRREADALLKKIKDAIAALKTQAAAGAEDTKDWFRPDALDTIWEPVVTTTRTGGASCVIIEKIQPREEPPIELDETPRAGRERSLLSSIREDQSEDQGSPSLLRERHLRSTVKLAGGPPEMVE